MSHTAAAAMAESHRMQRAAGAWSRPQLVHCASSPTRPGCAPGSIAASLEAVSIAAGASVNSTELMLAPQPEQKNSLGWLRVSQVGQTRCSIRQRSNAPRAESHDGGRMEIPIRLASGAKPRTKEKGCQRRATSAGRFRRLRADGRLPLALASCTWVAPCVGLAAPGGYDIDRVSLWDIDGQRSNQRHFART